MPVFAQLNLLKKLTGLIYFPITPTFPLLGLFGGLGYLPAKFKIRFLEPIPTDQWGDEPSTTRASCRPSPRRSAPASRRSSTTMLAERKSVWLG